MSRTPGSNGIAGVPRFRGDKAHANVATERDGRPFRQAVSVREIGTCCYLVTLECDHTVTRQFPAAQGAYCDVCGLEKALGQKLATPYGKSLAQRALKRRGSWQP